MREGYLAQGIDITPLLLLFVAEQKSVASGLSFLDLGLICD